VLTLFGFSSVSHAVPVEWVLDNAVLGNGDEATGSFVFDADVMAYNSTSVSLSGNNFDTAITLSNQDFARLVEAADLPGLNGDSLLRLLFASPLTNAGGVVDLELGFPSGSGLVGCLNDECTLTASGGDLNFASGSVVGRVVPEPSTVIMLSLAGCLVCVLCRR